MIMIITSRQLSEFTSIAIGTTLHFTTYQLPELTTVAA